MYDSLFFRRPVTLWSRHHQIVMRHFLLFPYALLRTLQVQLGGKKDLIIQKYQPDCILTAFFIVCDSSDREQSASGHQWRRDAKEKEAQDSGIRQLYRNI